MIAVTTAARVPEFPDLPTVAESGLPGYDVETWYGLYLPAGTPKPIVDKLNLDVNAVLQQPSVMMRFSITSSYASCCHKSMRFAFIPQN